MRYLTCVGKIRSSIFEEFYSSWPVLGKTAAHARFLYDNATLSPAEVLVDFDRGLSVCLSCPSLLLSTDRDLPVPRDPSTAALGPSEALYIPCTRRCLLSS